MRHRRIIKLDDVEIFIGGGEIVKKDEDEYDVTIDYFSYADIQITKGKRTVRITVGSGT